MKEPCIKETFKKGAFKSILGSGNFQRNKGSSKTSIRTKSIRPKIYNNVFTTKNKNKDNKKSSKNKIFEYSDQLSQKNYEQHKNKKNK